MTRAALRTPLCALCLALLAGCGSSPPVHHYALARPEAGGPVSGSARVLVEILPVAVPEGLVRSNLVLTDGQGWVSVLESERWLAPIADDLRQIVADGLWRTAWAADSYQAPVPGPSTALPQYRLALRLDRFDAFSGWTATVAGSWTLRRLPNGPVHGCRWEGRQPVDGPDVAAAATALSDASRRLAGRIGDSLRRALAAQADVCPEEDESR
ncbi:PqiC family protein [Azospirillum sp. TSO22-1]|uniref:PqiC family protein n=1 Tax=Azospirillum sp. TSO22-1 TaxID=716789 RepID=UPI000D6154CF|nr:PqiC family protein [Azospirillum sp. TSO22-1]PWC54824.1 hypothetical protein TSO221_06895 [Azospirillum sp. TSO22-1]